MVGCGDGGAEAPPIATVSGKVTFDGTAVSEGVVNFNGVGFGAQATLGSDGTYELTSQYGSGIPLGSYKISIEPPPPETKPDTAELVDAGDFENIPKKYRSPETSGFTAEVKEGSNTFDFDMKKQ